MAFKVGSGFGLSFGSKVFRRCCDRLLPLWWSAKARCVYYMSIWEVHYARSTPDIFVGNTGHCVVPHVVFGR